MPKGRIGLSLDEDVLAILNEYGRSEKLPPCPECRYKIIPGDGCLVCNGSGVVNDPRPPRYEIVAQGVRMWAEAKAGAGISGRYMEPLFEGNGGLPDPPDVQRRSSVQHLKGKYANDPSWKAESAVANCHHLARYRVGQMCTACGVSL